MQRRSYLRQVGAASAVGVTGGIAGCSGDEGTTDAGNQTDSGGDEAVPDQTVDVAIGGNLAFTPEEFTISAGDTIRWRWQSGGHNVVPDEIPDGSDWGGSEGAPEETLDEGASHRYTFETTGEYTYYCNPHQGQGMTGSFTVEES